MFHADCGLLGCVDRPIRREHRRGTSRHFDCFPILLETNPSCSSYALMHQNQQSTFFSSGLPVEVDAALHAIFGSKTVASFSRYVPRILYIVWAHCSAAFLAPSCVVWISVRKSWRVGVAMTFRSTLDNAQKWSHLFPNVDDSFRSFRVFEFEMRSLEISCRSPSKRLSHVRNRLFWLFDVLRYTMQFGITA